MQTLGHILMSYSCLCWLDTISEIWNELHSNKRGPQMPVHTISSSVGLRLRWTKMYTKFWDCRKNRPKFSILSVYIGIIDKMNTANSFCIKERPGIEPMATWLIVTLYWLSWAAHQLRVVYMVKALMNVTLNPKFGKMFIVIFQNFMTP